MIIAAPSDARSRLKQETNDLHRWAEAAFDRADWLASPASYLLLLERWASLLRFLESGYAPFFAAGDIASAIGGRLQRLARDLASLHRLNGIDHPAPPPAETPLFGNHAEAFGSLYVVEGSALGGRIIAKQVRDRLGPAMPTAFLEGTGAPPGPAWLRFLDRLDQALDSSAAIDSAVKGARHTFTLVEAWLGTPTIAAALPAR